MPSLFAAFDPATGQVIGQLHRRHRHQEFLKPLKAIDANTPAEIDLHLMRSNYATHVMLRHSRFTCSRCSRSAWVAPAPSTRIRSLRR